ASTPLSCWRRQQQGFQRQSWVDVEIEVLVAAIQRPQELRDLAGSGAAGVLHELGQEVSVGDAVFALCLQQEDVPPPAAPVAQPLVDGGGLAAETAGQRVRQLEAVRQARSRQFAGGGQALRACRQQVGVGGVGQRQPDAALGQPREQLRLLRRLAPLRQEVADDLARRQPELDTGAAGANRLQQQVLARRDEDEHRVGRRLLQRLEEAVLRLQVHRVGGIDDDDAVAALVRFEGNGLLHLP